MKASLGAAGAGLILACQIVVGAPPTVQQLVDEFSATNYYDLVANKLYTRQGMNRAAGTGPQREPCRDAIHAELLRVGLNPVNDEFTYRDTNGVLRNACNVIAVQHGVMNPHNEVYVVGGHYDSKSNPGADDNGTGVGCILEMARIFSKYHFAKTLVYCLFDAEEISDYYGARRLGSVRFVEQHRTANIKGMISVDMIGWQGTGSQSNSAYIEGRAVMAPIRNDLKNAMLAYGGGLVPILRTGSGDYSDHVAFADAGFQACLLIEAYFSSNPNYHKATDYVELPDYLDWTYAGKMCRTVIGYYATKLEPVDVTPVARGIHSGTNGVLAIDFTGITGCAYAVEVSHELRTPVWSVLATNTASLTDGSFQAIDAGAGDKESGFYRARFVSGYTGTAPVEIVIDNPAAGVVGDWSTGTSAADKFGADYRFRSPGTGAAYLEYRPNIPASGNYAVYEWHPQGLNRTTEAPMEIRYATGTQTVRINQQINGGGWVLLGTYLFDAGSTGYVRIKDNFTTGSVVMADAIKFVYAP
jgi:hypothetical protein